MPSRVGSPYCAVKRVSNGRKRFPPAATKWWAVSSTKGYSLRVWLRNKDSTSAIWPISWASSAGATLGMPNVDISE